MSGYKKREVKRLLELAQGARTDRKYAQMAGISHTNLIKLKNMEHQISMKMIQKLTSKEAEPCNGVTAEMIMRAAGYIESNQGSFPQAEENDYNTDEMEVIVKSLLFQVLADKVKSFSSINVDDVAGTFFSPNLAIEIETLSGEKMQHWISCNCFSSIETSNLEKKVVFLLSKIIFLKKDKNRVITIFVDTREAFEMVNSFKEAYAYDGNVYVALIDMEKRKLICESSVVGDNTKGLFYD